MLETGVPSGNRVPTIVLMTAGSPKWGTWDVIEPIILSFNIEKCRIFKVKNGLYLKLKGLFFFHNNFLKFYEYSYIPQAYFSSTSNLEYFLMLN